MTITQVLENASSKLDAAGIPGGRLDAQLLLAHATGRSREWLIAHDKDEIDQQAAKTFEALINKRLARIPVVHLTGTREFYGLDFRITPDVLTPRVETEQMVEWAIKYAPKKSRLIDIGTGSGAIAIAIAKYRPDLDITATEVTGEALDIARSNAKKHQVALTFVKSDLWDNVTGKFATIVTNLPYLRQDADLMDEVKHEPEIALLGGPDGLDLYRRLLMDARDFTMPRSYLFTESDPWQHGQLTELARDQGYLPIEQGYFVLGFQAE